MRRLVAFVLILQTAVPAAWAWDAHGHRTITYLALDGLPPEAPAWLHDPAIRDRIAYEASEPDRFRGTKLPVLGHENNPDHYFDVDLLDQFGLTLETVSPFRYEYLRAMAIAKHVHPEKVEPYDAGKDTDKAQEWPGFALHAIAEHYAKLRSAFNTLRILEQLHDPARAAQLEMARANVLYHMGMLSHFVGDSAQPLHTTKHHHGWVGDNPNGYTTNRGIHAQIDGGMLELHQLTFAALRPQMKYEIKVNANDPWKDVLIYFQRSHEKVEPLYQLEKSGDLKKDVGKEFIRERLCDAGAMLSALYWAAYASAAPTDLQVADFIKYDNFKPELLPSRPTAEATAASQPASQPTDAEKPATH